MHVRIYKCFRYNNQYLDLLIIIEYNKLNLLGITRIHELHSFIQLLIILNLLINILFLL